MFEPAVVPLEAYRNGVLRTQFSVTKDTSALDLTGYELKMQVRLKPHDPVLAEASSTGASPDGSVITIISTTTGVFEVYISNLDFQDISPPTGQNAGDVQTFYYDILFKVPVSNDLLPLIKGTLKLNQGITIQ